MTEEKLKQGQELLDQIKTLRSALWNSVGVPCITRDPHLFREACEIVLEDVEKLLDNKLLELEKEFADL